VLGHDPDAGTFRAAPQHAAIQLDICSCCLCLVHNLLVEKVPMDHIGVRRALIENQNRSRGSMEDRPADFHGDHRGLRVNTGIPETINSYQASTVDRTTDFRVFLQKQN
jgi:hypothetical protein